MSLLFLIPLLLLAGSEAASDVNPFTNGTLKTDHFDIPKTNNTPLHSMVFYPTVPGVYPLYFFVSGFRGMMPSSTYSTYLRGVASHGFVVVSTDHIDMDSFDEKVRLFMERFEMTKTSLNAMLAKHTPGVTINLNNITLGSHSAGGEVTIAMMKINHSGIKASVFLEPMVIYLKTAIPFDLPAVMYGTQFSEESAEVIFPPCVVPEYDYRHVYSNWLTPKIQMEAKGYGHCDILDPETRKMCGEMHLCKMVQNADLTKYQLYIQGLTTGFLNWVLFKTNDFNYLTNASLAPIPLLNMKFEVSSEPVIMERL